MCIAAESDVFLTAFEPGDFWAQKEILYPEVIQAGHLKFPELESDQFAEFAGQASDTVRFGEFFAEPVRSVIRENRIT